MPPGRTFEPAAAAFIGQMFAIPFPTHSIKVSAHFNHTVMLVIEKFSVKIIAVA